MQSNRIAQEFSRKFGGTYTQFLSPAVFSEQKAMEYFLKEKSISYIFDDFQKLDTLIMGIGIPQRVESTLEISHCISLMKMGLLRSFVHLMTV